MTGSHFQKRTVQLQLPVYLFSFLTGIYQEYRVFINIIFNHFFKSLISKKALKRSWKQFLFLEKKYIELLYKIYYGLILVGKIFPKLNNFQSIACYIMHQHNKSSQWSHGSIKLCSQNFRHLLYFPLWVNSSKNTEESIYVFKFICSLLYYQSCLHSWFLNTEIIYKTWNENI